LVLLAAQRRLVAHHHLAHLFPLLAALRAKQ
jgi:hypothetical protein